MRIAAVKEPLIKSHEGATLAFRDEMREARRSEWLTPLRKPSDKADRPKRHPGLGLAQRGAGRGASCCKKHRKTGRSCCHSRTPSFAYRVAAAVPSGFRRNAALASLRSS